jgi:hypothetical protein
MWLGGATIGEIGGLLVLTFRGIFGQNGKSPKPKPRAKLDGQ